MGYRAKPQYRGRKTSYGSGTVKTVALVMLLVGVFAGSVYVFRTSHASRAKSTGLPVAITKAEAAALLADPELVTIELANLEKGSGSGTATLERKDGKIHVSLKTSPPPIDRATTTYEAWLFSRLPFGFFPLGELVTDELGAFILEWEQADQARYATYRTIIVTREAKDANPDPGAHVLEGTFEKK